MTRCSFLLSLLLAIPCCLSGCRPAAMSDGDDPADGNASTVGEFEEFLEIDEEMSPQEIDCLLAAKDFYVAVADGDYERAYDLLSEHATRNVHPYQFAPAEAAGRATGSDPARLDQLTKADFVSEMQELAQRFGPPRDVLDLYLYESDPDVLSGKGDRLDVMFAIGMMPDSVPAELRKAAFRGEIRCRFKEEDMPQVMDETGLSAEELEHSDDFYPYFNLKTVVLAEEGELRVGYFEFLPPSILD